jgi:aminoglycoside phosphotransferase family enzyme
VAVDAHTVSRSCQLTTDEKLRLLRRELRHRYGGRIETIETHFAWVFLTSQWVFKLKKAVRRAPMDYRTLAARRRGCEQELRLNRRLAPSVYRSIVRLVRTSDGALRLDGPGRVEDYLVKMRQLPQRRMLDRMIVTGLTARQLDRLIATLAHFFASAARRPMGGPSYLRRLRTQIANNHRALRRACANDRTLIDQVYRAQRRFLQCAGQALAARGATLIDGHGDLRAEHINLGKTVSVIDCLEFDRDLRRLDPMQELAQLCVEIDYLGDRALAQRMMQRYCEQTGQTIAAAELWFYRSHTATTRAKLAAWHIGDPQFPDVRSWQRRTRRYLLQALRAIRCAHNLFPGGGQAMDQSSRSPARPLIARVAASGRATERLAARAVDGATPGPIGARPAAPRALDRRCSVRGALQLRRCR